ncbi:neuroguidin [Impatiens glandulifera]|uniref:neuroguidin n=1 Tax=Impatiens glandulifera TaxID=253017 RepID=UPI001FB0AB01|nr:neuroguidin [Impatiens glandulifera]
MVDSSENTKNVDMIERETPQLLAVLKEMKDGLETVTCKIQVLTAKVKDNLFPTSDGLSYLEAKQLLLLNYCQSLVYYLLCKAKGFSIESHPVVLSLVETRLFLEKIRPIEKKLQYQTDKLMRVSEKSTDSAGVNATVEDPSKKEDDLLKYRPNPDMLISKTESVLEDEASAGVYRPPKFAPTSMEEDKMSKQERNAARLEKQTLRQASQNSYVRDLMHDLEGKPEEVREEIGVESMELTNYRAKMEDRARREEELFTRAPLTRVEKTKMKHMKRSRNGLLGLTDSFYNEIKSLPLEEENKSIDNQPAFVAEKTRKKQKVI